MKVWSNIEAFGLQVAVGVNLLTFMALLFTGYSGYINPEEMPFAALAGMSYCLWLILTAVLLIIDLILWRKLALVPLAGILATMGPMLTFAPLNFAPADSADNDSTFTVLTYNVFHYSDARNPFEQPETNLTVRYIMASGADIVCIQEGGVLRYNPGNAISREMVDSLNRIYPYHEADTTGLVVYSRYPLTREMLPLSTIDSGSFVKLHLTIHNHPITLYNVHLQCTGLSLDDRAYYKELTKEPRDASIGQVKQRLIQTLYDGYAVRAVQARLLAGYVGHDKGTVILCGDFNDVPGSYPLRQLEGAGMKDAFYEAGLGPAITYNLNRFYFRIDQSLYKGSVKPISVNRVKTGISDHYPVMTKYMITANDK